MEQFNSKVNLILQCYAEVASRQDAENLLPVIESTVKDVAQIDRVEIEQYWKIPQYHSITIWLLPKIETQAVVTKLMESYPECWSVINEKPGWSAVWNQNNGLVLFEPEIRWANLELWYR